MISFKIGTVRISFEFGFFAVVTLFCLLDAPELALTAVCACAVHELGHILAAVISDVKIERVIFRASGIKMESRSSITGVPGDTFVLLAGPFMNFAAAVFYYFSGCYTPFSVNLILGLFNLLPFTSLDGGALIKNLLEYFGVNAERIMKITAVISAAIIFMIFYFTGSGGITSCLTILFLTLCEMF
ncbi:MAG: site-2 protease family protein [Porcipelethomonas sp.]